MKQTASIFRFLFITLCLYTILPLYAKQALPPQLQKLEAQKVAQRIKYAQELDKAIETNNGQKIVKVLQFFQDELGRWILKQKVDKGIKTSVIQSIHTLTEFQEFHGPLAQTLVTLLTTLHSQLKSIPKYDSAIHIIEQFRKQASLIIEDAPKLNKMSVKIESTLFDFQRDTRRLLYHTILTRFDRFKKSVLPYAHKNLPALIGAAASLTMVALIIYGLRKHNQQDIEEFTIPTDIKLKDLTLNTVVELDVKEVIDQLKDPESFEHAGIKQMSGLLLSGKPGTGKTRLAQAIAAETERPFLKVSASSFIEKYIGTGASRVRSTFKRARSKQGTILFIDEIDAIGTTRSSRDEGGTREYTQALTQLLVELSDEKNKDVFVIAATNRLDSLDPALTRPGRFRPIHIPLPDYEARIGILKHFLTATKVKFKDIEKNIDVIKGVSGKTEGMTGANLEELVNMSLRFAKRAGQNYISIDSLNKAVAKSEELLSTRLKAARRGRTSFGAVGLDQVLLNQNEINYFKQQLELMQQRSASTVILVEKTPGTNMSDIARAIAHEGKASYHESNAGEKLRKVFGDARRDTPAILLLDNINQLRSDSFLLNKDNEPTLIDELEKSERTKNLMVIAAIPQGITLKSEFYNLFGDRITLALPDQNLSSKIISDIFDEQGYEFSVQDTKGFNNWSQSKLFRFAHLVIDEAQKRERENIAAYERELNEWTNNALQIRRQRVQALVNALADHEGATTLPENLGEMDLEELEKLEEKLLAEKAQFAPDQVLELPEPEDDLPKLPEPPSEKSIIEQDFIKAKNKIRDIEAPLRSTASASMFN